MTWIRTIPAKLATLSSALTCLFVLAACGESRVEPAGEPATEPAAATATEAAPEPEAAPPSRPGPRLQHTAAEALGILPEDVGIRVGQPAPDARLDGAAGEPVQLAEMIARGPVLIVFYRGGWCPYCNLQIHDMVEAYPEYRRRGITPIAISVDRPEESARTRASYEIPFPVLSDPDLAAHRAYRVGRTVDGAQLERLRGFGIDLERASGRDHHVIAIPSVFFVDREGVVRWAHADPDYRTRPSDAQILAAIDAL